MNYYLHARFMPANFVHGLTPPGMNPGNSHRTDTPYAQEPTKKRHPPSDLRAIEMLAAGAPLGQETLGLSAAHCTLIFNRSIASTQAIAEDDLDHGEGFGPGTDKADNNSGRKAA